MKKTYSFEITAPLEEETAAAYFLARFRLIYADHLVEIARLEKYTGLTQAELVDLYIEDPSGLQFQTEELEPFTGHRGTQAERLNALRLAIEHLPPLFRDLDWNDSVFAALLHMVLQHCAAFRLVGDKTEYFLESKAIRANADAMKALDEEDFIELEATAEDRPNLTATVTTQAWLLLHRLKHEQARERPPALPKERLTAAHIESLTPRKADED
jgi:hypothetical protein